MTSTFQVNPTAPWYVVCRCGWGMGPYEDRDRARQAGDEHLEKFNQ